MKTLRVFFVFFASCMAVYAQEQADDPGTIVNRRMALDVSAGYSMAFGTYASEDRQDDKSGYANGGWQFQITFDWMGKKDLGMALQYTYQRNPLENMANEVYPYPNQVPDSMGPFAWSNHYLLAGPVFMKTIKKLYLDAKVLGGVMVSSSANFDTPVPSDTTGIRINENIATGFGYQVSAGVGYAFSPHVAIKFNVSLLGGWPGKNKQYGAQFIGYKEFIDPVTGLPYYEAVYSAPATFDMKKVVTTLNPSIGLVYRF